MRIGDAILCRRNMLAIGLLSPIYESQLDDNFNDANNLSFKYYRTDDNGELYNKLIDLELVYIPTHKKYYEIGVQENEDDQGVYKTVTGISLCEAELGQIILRNLEFNTELDIKRPDYRPTKIYDNTSLDTIQNSIMVRILKDKAPHYKLKHIDNSIGQLQRTFSIDGQSIIDFLRNTLAPEVHCAVEFGVEPDTKDRTISLYDMYDVCNECGYRAENFKINYKGKCPKCGSMNYKKGYGEDTNIVISTENLAESISVQTNKDNVKNCFYVTGGDDLLTNMVAAVNPNGTNYIWRFSEEQLADMSNELSSKLRDYNALYEERQSDYKDIMVHIYDILDKKSEINYGKAEYPSTNDSDCNTELQKILDEFQKELFKISVQSLKTASKTLVSNAIIQYARIFLSTGYSIKVLEGNTYDADTHKWNGILRVYKTTNDEIFADSPILTINVDDDYLNFLEQKIGKTLHQYDINNTKIEPDWTQYPLSILSSFESAYQACLDVLIEQGCGNSNNACYSLYKEYYDWHSHITEQINILEKEIAVLDIELNEYEKQKIEMQNILNIENYLGTDLWHELISYRREDEYNNPNFVSDGIVRNEEMLSKAEELFNMANEELKKACQTQYTVSSNLINFLEIPEFKAFADQCKLGNWIYIQTKYGDIYKLSIMNITYTDEIDKNLSVTFSNAYKTHTEINAVDDILKESQSMATSYDSTKYQAAAGKLASDDISAWVKEGLDASLYLIKNNNAEEVTLDNSGLICKSYDDVTDDYSSEQVKLTHNVLAFTKDNWETVSTALGKCTYHKYNEEEKQFETNEGYGLTSEFVQSGYVTGSQIVGGDIYSPNYIPKQKGTHIGLENAEFEFNGDGSGSQILLTHEKVGEADKLMLQMLKGDIIAGRIYSTDYLDMTKDSEGNPIGIPITSIDLNKGNFSFAKGDMVYEYDEQNENNYITFTQGGFQVKPEKGNSVSAGIFDKKGIDLHNGTNSHLGYFYLGSQGYTLDLGYDFENRESTNNSDYNIMQFLYNSDSLDVDAPSIRMRTPMIKEAEHNPRTQSELWYDGLKVQEVVYDSLKEEYIGKCEYPNIAIASKGISLANGSKIEFMDDESGFDNFKVNSEGHIKLLPILDDEGKETPDSCYIKTTDGFISDYDSVSNMSAALHCDSDGNAHYGLVNGEVESSNQVAEAELVLKSDGAYCQKGDGTLLPIIASNIGNVGILNYSLEEQLIGTWIDGKNLYQKTEHFGKLPNSGIKSVDHGIELLDSVINLNGFYYNPIEDAPLYHNIPSVGNPGDTLDAVNVSANSTAINVITGNDKSLYDSYITLMYTKLEKDVYTELLYVTTNQKFYMMTDYIPNVNTRLLFECDFYTHTDRRANFGVSTNNPIFYLTSEDTGVYYTSTGWYHMGDWNENIVITPANNSNNSNIFYKYEFGNNYIIRDGTKTSLSSKEFVNDKPLCLFAIPTYNSEGVITSYTSSCPTSELWSIKSLKIYEGENIKRDYIPVLGADGIPCLYDKVRHNFLKSIDSTPLPTSNYELKIRNDLENLGTPWWISTNPSAISINNSDGINKITVNSVGGFEKIYVRRRGNPEYNVNYCYQTKARRIKVEFKVRSLNYVEKNIEDFSVCSAFTYCTGAYQYNSVPLENYRENLTSSWVKGYVDIELNGDKKWHTYSYEFLISNNGFLGSDYVMIFDFGNVKDETTAELEIKDLTFTGYIDT